MMGYDHYKEADEIIKELHRLNYAEEADCLQESMDRGSTGTEIFMALKWNLNKQLVELQLPELLRAKAKKLIKELESQLG